MKVVIAPNALKDSLSAIEAAEAIKSGVLKTAPTVEAVSIPIADGGDGLLQVLERALNGEWKTVTVSGPLGKPLQASFLYSPSKSLAVVELASAAGLALLEKHEYDIRKTSTYGVGQLINAALELDIDHLVLGIGGSATNDVAMGMSAALGVKFLNQNGIELEPCAKNLVEINSIDTSSVNKKLKKIQFDIVCDVSNPLLGDFGSAAIFGPQKVQRQRMLFFWKRLLHILQAFFKNKKVCNKKI